MPASKTVKVFSLPVSFSRNKHVWEKCVNVLRTQMNCTYICVSYR